MKHQIKSLFNLSKKFHFSFFFLIIISSLANGCSSTKRSNDSNYSEAWLQTQNLVKEFGQVTSEYHLKYLKVITERLVKPFKEHRHPQIYPRIILLNTKQPMALWPGSNFILISRGLILGLNTESELAFVIAHELSHQALGHTHLADDQLGEALTTTLNALEIEADRMALGVVALAGYDPRSAIPALQNSYRQASPFIRSHNDYPTLEKRINEAIQAIKESKWSGLAIGDRREFQIFKESLKSE